MTASVEITAAQAGLNSDRQIEIALTEIVALGGEATSEQLYHAVERYLPSDATLSQQGRATLRSLVNRDAVAAGYIEPYSDAHPGWRITPAGRVYLDSLTESSGTEQEDTLPDSESGSPIIAPEANASTNIRPFDPTSIRVDQRMMSIFEVMRKIQRKSINLAPDFQRNFVWNDTRKSRLIESILLRIPLPAFYLDAAIDDTWLVVDGLQRLSTLDDFLNKGKLVLSNLEFLIELEGKHFKELPFNLQQQIEDTELNLYIIRPETPPEVKFTIFSRVNTGGLVLTPQEIRHALFQGRATTYLAELAQLPEFLNATTYSIKSLRMDDRECVLRFLAFHMTPYQQYGRQAQRDRSGRVIQANLDGFLSEAMQRLNALEHDPAALDRLREAFRTSMIKAEAVFGQYAFRKMYQRQGRRTQISKPLFEVWSTLLVPYTLEQVLEKRDAIIDGFIDLMGDVEFNKAISLGTGSATTVQRRFARIEQLLKECIG
ncbi:MAG: DUF262 domain-containing protein [Roseiflexaceae bacterium]|nr:DUF262 domain-containing protein [Roseiflexaceae bacterium]